MLAPSHKMNVQRQFNTISISLPVPGYQLAFSSGKQNKTLLQAQRWCCNSGFWIRTWWQNTSPEHFTLGRRFMVPMCLGRNPVCLHYMRTTGGLSAQPNGLLLDGHIQTEGIKGKKSDRSDQLFLFLVWIARMCCRVYSSITLALDMLWSQTAQCAARLLFIIHFFHRPSCWRMHSPYLQATFGSNCLLTTCHAVCHPAVKHADARWTADRKTAPGGDLQCFDSQVRILVMGMNRWVWHSSEILRHKLHN